MSKNVSITKTQDKGYGSFMVIENDIVGDCIRQLGCWENHLAHYYLKFIKSTDVIVDAGANIGFHTVQFAKLANKVYAFEPQKLIFNILSTNLLLNSVSDFVEHYRVALGDKPGKLYMEPLSNRRQESGQENFGGLGLVTENNGQQEVKVITFDSLELDIDVLKMDIQGSEPYALKGMENTIDKCTPWIMLENYPDRKPDQKVFKWLIDKGYECFRFEQEKENTWVPHEDCIFYNPEKHIHIKQELDELRAHIKNLKENSKNG